MILKEIEISNFRNYSHLSLEFSKNINIIYGNNGQGKTNLLESIYVLAFTKSHRSFIDNNLIKKNEMSASLKGTILNDISYKLDLLLNSNSKQIKIDNKKAPKISSYITKTNIIIFSSEDIELIKGGPLNRRKYLNIQLSQLSENYYQTLNDYNKLLKMRNDCLKKINNNEYVDMNYFNIITEYLINKSVFIYQMRNKYIERLNKVCPNVFEEISKLKGFHINYNFQLSQTTFDKESIKNKLKEIYAKEYQKEVMAKTTLYGPHRDDFAFYLNDQDLKSFGSQGQQKMAILALKLSEIEIFKDYKKTNPIILLDDVFSDLDNNKKNNLLKHIDKDSQVIITTTELDNIDSNILKGAKCILIENGKVVKEEVK